MVLAQWTQVYSTTYRYWIYALTVIDDYILAGGGDRIVRSADNGVSWDPEAILPTGVVSDFALLDDNCYAVTSWGCGHSDLCEGECVFRSSDSGATWQSIFSTKNGVSSIAVCCSSLFINPHQCLYRSDDFGHSWVRIDSNTIISEGPLFSWGGVLYGVQKGSVYRSEDHGQSWISISTGLPDEYIYGLVGNDSLLFIRTFQGVYRRAIAGDSWEPAGYGLPEKVWALRMYRDSLFAAAASVTSPPNVYLTTDNGNSWHDVSDGLTRTEHEFITSLLIKDGYLFAGGVDGIWRRPLYESLSVDSSLLPLDFTLCQNYPNPFNPNTTLRYELPQRAEVTLTVYDILGQEVVRLVDSYMEPGYHQAQWIGRDKNGRSVPSGVYIARLVTPEYTKSIKMLVLK